MNINRNINTTILTDNNESVLKLFPDVKVINTSEDLRRISESFVIFNDVLRTLKQAELERFLEQLDGLDIHFINITSNTEEALYAESLIVYYKEKVIVEGSTISVLKEERILKKLGFKLPFVYDFSLQLNYYGVLDSIFLDENVLVNKLWKN